MLADQRKHADLSKAASATQAFRVCIQDRQPDGSMLKLNAQAIKDTEVSSFKAYHETTQPAAFDLPEVIATPATGVSGF